MAIEKSKPMYFASLRIKNVKCFGDEQILDLKNNSGAISRWTVILGNNGLGKTTLLKCLVWMTITEEIDPDKKEQAKIPIDVTAVKPAIDGIEDEEYEQLSRIGEEVTSTIGAILTNGTMLGSIPKGEEIIDYSIEFKTIHGKLEEVKLPNLIPLKEYNAPIIYAYSASRHMELKNTDNGELFNPVSNLFSESGELYDATEQLLYQDHAALQENPRGRESALLEKMKNLISDLLPDVKSADDIMIYAKERKVKIKTEDGNIPLDSLSLGNKTMIAWSVDLALKMFSQNLESPSPLEEPAVVIIDEIDLHLHPTWQRELKQILTNHFPNTQFISTSHSPFIAQSSEEDNLAVLQRNTNNQVIIENDPYIVKGWRIGQVITSDLFGVNSERSPEIADLEEKRREILDIIEPLGEQQEKELKDLNEKLENLIPLADNEEDQKLMEQIRKTTDFLKNRGKLI